VIGHNLYLIKYIIKGEDIMNQLVIIQNRQAVTTSLQVAEDFGKEHKHVLDSIGELINGLAENPAYSESPMFYKDEYVHPQNKQKYPMYYMNRDGFTLLAMGFNGKKALNFKLKYIQAFNQMEQRLLELNQPSYMILDPEKRAEKWIEEHKEKRLLENKIEEQKPLVSFAERCLKSKDSILVRELAKVITEEGIINIGEKKLFTKLREWGLILKTSTEPSQRAMNMKLFDVIQRAIRTPYGDRLERTTKVLPKGQVYIVERLNKEIEDKKVAN